MESEAEESEHAFGILRIPPFDHVLSLLLLVILWEVHPLDGNPRLGVHADGVPDGGLVEGPLDQLELERRSEGGATRLVGVAGVHGAFVVSVVGPEEHGVGNAAGGHTEGAHGPAPPKEGQHGGEAKEVEELQQEASAEKAEHTVELDLVGELPPVSVDEVTVVVVVFVGLVAEQLEGCNSDASGGNFEETELGPHTHVVLIKELALFSHDLVVGGEFSSAARASLGGGGGTVTTRGVVGEEHAICHNVLSLLIIKINLQLHLIYPLIKKFRS